MEIYRCNQHDYKRNHKKNHASYVRLFPSDAVGLSAVKVTRYACQAVRKSLYQSGNLEQERIDSPEHTGAEHQTYREKNRAMAVLVGVVNPIEQVMPGSPDEQNSKYGSQYERVCKVEKKGE